MKLDKKHTSLLFALFMSLGMAFAMSFVMTLINLGFTDDFILKWMGAFIIGFLVALPTSLFIMPYAKKIVEKLTAD